MKVPAETTSIALREAWANYHATLEEMRQMMEVTPRFQETPQHRTKAYHTLMEMQAMAYNFAIAPRMSHPRIRRVTPEQRKQMMTKRRAVMRKLYDE